MPIYLNLLAEAQTAEDLRRRDPVKRVIIGGLLVVALMLAWSSFLQLKVMMANRELGQAQFQIDTHTNAYETVLTNTAKIVSTKMKIEKLQKLTNARMLQGNLLNALQMVTVDNVQLMNVKVNQDFIGTGGGKQAPGVTERTVVNLDARDYSVNAGDQVGKFSAALARQAYFRDMLDKTNGIRLAGESSPQQDQSGKTFVLFTLECHFPDKKR
jgi:hypothetical protein